MATFRGGHFFFNIVIGEIMNDRDNASNDRRNDRARRDDAPSRNHRDRERADQQPDRPDWQKRVDRPINADRPKSPLIPEEITAEDLAMQVRVQLKTLTAENAEMTARHLAMAGLLFDQDPQLAHAHAVAAVNRAGRIAVVRETVGVTAYAVEDWALSLRELLSHRRMTGSNAHVPMMVDCERGLGRPAKGLEMGRAVDRSKLDPETRVKLAIAMSGARLDLGENELALAELEILELDPSKVFDYSPALFFAYGDTLEVLGRDAESKKWLELGERAEKALAPKLSPEDEEFVILEEIQLPTAADRPKRVEHDFDGPRPPRRDGDAPRPPRRDGDKPFRPRSDADGPRPPRRDGDAPRPPRRDGDAPRGPGAGGPSFGGPRGGRPGGGFGGPRGGGRPGGPAGGAPRGGRPGGSRGR